MEQICQCHEITIAKLNAEKMHFRETIQSLKHQNAQLINDLGKQGKSIDDDKSLTTTTTTMRTVTRHEEEIHIERDLQILSEDIFKRVEAFQHRLNRLIETSRENRKHAGRIANVVTRLLDRIHFESSLVESLRSQEIRLSSKIRDVVIERESLKDVLRKSRLQHVKIFETQRELKSSHSVLRAQVASLEHKKIELTERLLAVTRTSPTKKAADLS